MRVKTVCGRCFGGGCETCDGRCYVWRFERDPEVTCRVCGESFREGSQEAEFIGWHGKCAQCELESE